MKKLAVITVVLGAVMSMFMAGPAAANTKVTICHAAGLAGTTQYVTLTIAWQAVYGEAGHFYENGTPRAGHEQDYLGPCNPPDDPPDDPVLVEVCDPATGDIIEVPEDEADQYLPVDDPACDEVPPPDKGVKVCDPKTGEIIRVDEDMADQYLPVNDPACKDKPNPPPCAGGSCTPDPPPPAKCEEGHVSGDQNKACDSLPFTGAHWWESNSFKGGLSGLLAAALLTAGGILRVKGRGN